MGTMKPFHDQEKQTIVLMMFLMIQLQQPSDSGKNPRNSGDKPHKQGGKDQKHSSKDRRLRKGN